MSNATVAFVDYRESTVDPGWSFIVATLVACLLLNLSLPCLVSLGSKYEMRRNQETSHRNGSNNINNGEGTSDGDGRSTTFVSKGLEHRAIVDLNGVSTAPEGIGLQMEYIDTRNSDVSGQKEEEDEVMPKETDDLQLSCGGHSNNIRSFLEKMAPSGAPDAVTGKSLSDASLPTDTIASTSTDAMNNGKNTTIVDWFCGVANVLISPPYPEPAGRYPNNMCGLLPDSYGGSIASYDSSFFSLMSTSIFGGGLNNNRARRMNGSTVSVVERVHIPSVCAVNRSGGVGFTIIDPPDSGPTIRKFGSGDLGGGGVVTSVQKLKNRSHAGSALSRLNPDDVSFNEAIDYYGDDKGQYHLPNDVGTGEVDILCGEHAWWKPSMIAAGFNRVVGVAEWDNELTTIFNLALPLSLQSLLSGILTLLDISLVGYMFGTNEANAFILITLLTELTNTINYGFFETLGSVLPYVIGTANEGLAGKYLDTSLILYSVGSIPAVLVWSTLAGPITLWFGFDEVTAELAKSFAFSQVVLEYMSGLGYCMHLLFDLTGHERFGSFTTLFFSLSQTTGVIMPLFVGQKTLGSIGIWRLGLSMFTMTFSAIVASSAGWFRPFREGLLTGWLPNWTVVKKTVKTSIPLGVSYLLTYGEWNLLAIFASALGPAEVAAWCILRYLWAALGCVSDGVGDAAELQCAYHLGTNNPEMARLSAYKSVYMGFVSACFATSVVFFVGEDLVRWITPDPTLERLLLELLPLLGIGQVAMTASTIAWALVGAQGRSQLATGVHFFGTWFVTIPLSILITYILNINLQGLLAALVLGHTLAGTGNMYILIRSQWGRLAKLAAAEYETDDTSSSEDVSPPAAT